MRCKPLNQPGGLNPKLRNLNMQLFPRNWRRRLRIAYNHALPTQGDSGVDKLSTANVLGYNIFVFCKTLSTTMGETIRERMVRIHRLLMSAFDSCISSGGKTIEHEKQSHVPATVYALRETALP